MTWRSSIASSSARLGLRRGAVDFVGQQHLGEDRARVEGEAVLLAVVNGNADDVGRQQVAGELDAVELQARATWPARAPAWSCPRPGTSSISRWPPASRQTSAWRICGFLADDDLADLGGNGMHFGIIDFPAE